MVIFKGYGFINDSRPGRHYLRKYNLTVVLSKIGKKEIKKFLKTY